MSHDHVEGVSNASFDRLKPEASKTANMGLIIEQDLDSEAMDEAGTEGDIIVSDEFNNKSSTLKERAARLPHQERATGGSKLLPFITAIAETFIRRNPELQLRTLLILSEVQDDDNEETILDKITQNYPDPFLVDECLEFLIAVKPKSSKIYQTLQTARENWQKENQKDIRVGRNISQEARTFAKDLSGSPTQLRDLYRQIIADPKEPLALFEELLEQFDFEKMKALIGFVLHAVGADLRSKGPSIDPEILKNLLVSGRSMQAILGVYRFFCSNISYLQGQFDRQSIPYPSQLTFQILSRVFVQMLGEKYPSAEKALRVMRLLGITDDLIATVIVLTLYRDGIRQVSPRFFKQDKQRQDLLMAILDAIEELDEELEEEEENLKDGSDDQKDESDA